MISSLGVIVAFVFGLIGITLSTVNVFRSAHSPKHDHFNNLTSWWLSCFVMTIIGIIMMFIK